MYINKDSFYVCPYDDASILQQVFSSSTRDISLMRIGRMAPETTIDILAQELKAELKEKGIAQLQKNLEEEKRF